MGLNAHSHPVLRQQATQSLPGFFHSSAPLMVPDYSGVLEQVFRSCQGSEQHFRHKAILFIGAECYDAPTVTILQGLDELGFTVYTVGKPNVSAWFCNQIVDDLKQLKFDFILSNLQWGVRWSYYDRFELHGRLRVLVDGCDNHGDLTWRQKINRVRGRWRSAPPDDVALKDIQPYEWGESEATYEPDILFASQKFSGYDAVYQPFGIQRDFLKFKKGKPTTRRSIDFAHVTGQGSARARLESWFKETPPPGRVYAGSVGGVPVVDDRIKSLVDSDGEGGVHSYFRWIHYEDYFGLLNDAKVLVYPNVWLGRHWWDSKRPWEAYAGGCLVMLERPSVDMGEYPATDLCPYAVYDTREEFLDKCRYLYGHQDELERLRAATEARALKYFTPRSLARRFLKKIAERV
jgi:glycosyltransferase involved in cell wall biosynthesis